MKIKNSSNEDNQDNIVPKNKNEEIYNEKINKKTNNKNKKNTKKIKNKKKLKKRIFKSVPKPKKEDNLKEIKFENYTENSKNFNY